MKQKDFGRLVTSVKQAGAIRRGRLKPAQTTEFRPEDVGKIRTQTRSVFLSFSTEDKGLVDLFRSQARDRQPDLVFRDYSIKETFEHAWKTNAERLIRACSVTLCLIGRATHRSKAVDWEIRKSVELDKYIMAVSLEPTVPRVPPALVALNVAPLPWDIERIVGELNDIGTRDRVPVNSAAVVCPLGPGIKTLQDNLLRALGSPAPKPPAPAAEPGQV